MADDIPYHERIKDYSLDDLVDVITHIDREHYPDRYELVLREMDKRRAAMKPPPDAQTQAGTPEKTALPDPETSGRRQGRNGEDPSA
jgi:hypothetical protein